MEHRDVTSITLATIRGCAPEGTRNYYANGSAFHSAVPGTLASAQNIFTIAGIPYTHRNDVDGQPGFSAPPGSVYGLLIDKVTGHLIFNDQLLALRLDPDGSLITVAGSGSTFARPVIGAAGSNLASALSITVLRGMAQDGAGAPYLADAGMGRVYRIAPDGTVITFAGGGRQPPGFQSDGGPATAAVLQSPRGLVFDSKGNLDIAEVFCNCIRQVTPGGIIGTLYMLPPPPVQFGSRNIEGLAIDAQDNLYFTEWFGNLVVKVAPDGSAATTIAGTGTPGYSGDGGPATEAQLHGPSGVTLDAAGNIYIADTLHNRIRKIAPDGSIESIAGTGTCGLLGDGGPAASAQLCQPAQTVLDTNGNLIVSDYGNRRVRKITADGTMTTIAGSGRFDAGFSSPGSSGDGVKPGQAMINPVRGDHGLDIGASAHATPVHFTDCLPDVMLPLSIRF